MSSRVMKNLKQLSFTNVTTEDGKFNQIHTLIEESQKNVDRPVKTIIESHKIKYDNNQ